MKSIAIAAAVLGLSAAVVHAQMKPEDQVRLRRAHYSVMGYNFGNLGAMAQDKKPYNKDEAARNADVVATMAEYPRLFFAEGTDKVGDSKAKPEIWKNRSDFDAKMDKMIAETKKLPQAARTDLAALKKAVGDTGAACKACHDDYRAK